MAHLRAVIYCRCSTEEESQVDALRNQVTEGRECVSRHGWFLVDSYIESKSGTTTKGRDEYNRLYDDLVIDKFDIIVIKSQDRLMRNVKDWYLFLDRMITHGKRLFMYLEGKFYSADDALITGIKAILAEEYSRELSKKINNAHRHRQQHGGKIMMTSRVFGFVKRPDGMVDVVEEEARIIRQIYEYCAAGYGSRTVANLFLNQGYRKKTGGAITASFVGKVIRNPLYKGDMVLNRFHYDFETKRTIKVPENEWIYVKGAVPAIVSEELWEQANAAQSKRAKNRNQDGSFPRGSNPGKYELSGKLICANCGKPYYRIWRNGYGAKDKELVINEWKCSSYLTCGRKEKNRRDKLRKLTKEFEEGCDNVHLNEETVFSLLEQVSTEYYSFDAQDKDSIISHALEILKKVLSDSPTDSEWNNLEAEARKLSKQKDILLNKLLDGVISDTDYRKKDSQLEEKLKDIQSRKEKLEQKEWEFKNLEQRIQGIKERLESGGLEKATVAQMLQDIKYIKVHEWQLEICFDPLKIMKLSGSETEQRGIAEGLLFHDGFTIFVDYPFSLETERGRYLERRRIMKYLGENPDTTVRQMAEAFGHSLYMVQCRVKELNKGGYIRFHGKGGRGSWEVLKELPDKEISIKTGGL